MLTRIVFYSILLASVETTSIAQQITSLTYSAKVIIGHDSKVGGNSIGGLSGIAFNSNDGAFYVVADKPPARLCRIFFSEDIQPLVTFDSCLELSPKPLKKSELEGIVYNPKTNNYFVSDEQKEGTRILEIDDEAELVRIVEPQNQPFLDLSGHNSGIEGLTMSSDQKSLYYSYERPTAECQEKGLVEIRKKTLDGTKPDVLYYYQLHKVNGDIINTNGISEILYLNDSALMVMERAYIPGIGNIVRLFRATIGSRYQLATDLPCTAATPLLADLLFDFVSVPEVKIDNAEGMAFNADKSKLYIVTDNNFSKRQQTQFIVLDVGRD